MATAIPPRAAEVASKRPVRQKFLCSEAGGTSWMPGLWGLVHCETESIYEKAR